MRRLALTTILLVLVLSSCGDDDSNPVEDATTRDFEFPYDTGDLEVTTGGACVPGTSLGEALLAFPEYQELAEHVESIEVAKIEYLVPRNATPESGRIVLYLGEVEGFEPGDEAATEVAETGEILAGATVDVLTRVNWIGDGRAVVNGYVNDFQAEPLPVFFLCGFFEPLGADVDMTIRLTITLKVTVGLL